MLTFLSFTVYWTLIHDLISASSSSDAQRDVPSWHQYVRAPSTRSVSPEAVLSQYTNGAVTDPENLIHGGETTFSRSDDAAPIPTVVLDFGQNVVGLLAISFNTSASYAPQGYPGMKLSFSETLEFLTSRSDFTRSDNGEGVSRLFP